MLILSFEYDTYMHMCLRERDLKRKNTSTLLLHLDVNQKQNSNLNNITVQINTPTLHIGHGLLYMKIMICNSTQSTLDILSRYIHKTKSIISQSFL